MVSTAAVPSDGTEFKDNIEKALVNWNARIVDSGPCSTGEYATIEFKSRKNSRDWERRYAGILFKHSSYYDGYKLGRLTVYSGQPETIRSRLKRDLLIVSPICGLCGKKGTDMHEIVCPPLSPDKYHPNKDDPLAQAVYCAENCVILCNKCNVLNANSLRDRLIQHNMGVYGVEAVVQAYRRMAACLHSASSWIPVSIDYGGEAVRILP